MFSIILIRIFDILISLYLLVLLLPLYFIISFLILIFDGKPIHYISNRIGKLGKIFQIYKFRTMKVCDSGQSIGLKQATYNDPRVTKIGKFLRKWSLDELPQLINVIRGEMSLVGPRPHAVAHNEYYRKKISGYMQRHYFKPGITGLAQVEGYRGETSTLIEMSNRVEADLRYMNNWSIFLDFKILIYTLLKIKSKKAY